MREGPSLLSSEYRAGTVVYKLLIIIFGAIGSMLGASWEEARAQSTGVNSKLNVYKQLIFHFSARGFGVRGDLGSAPAHHLRAWAPN